MSAVERGRSAALASFLSLIFAAAVSAQPLAERLRARIGDFSGAVSLYARNLDTGASIGIRESDPVRTASTIKLPIMLAVFDAVARGQAKWTEPLTVTASEKVSGTGILSSEISEGVKLPLSDVVHLMIVLSDNPHRRFHVPADPCCGPTNSSLLSYLRK